MASMEQLELLTGRALLNKEFLTALLEDPQAAANSMGIHLKPSQVNKLVQFRGREKELLAIVDKIYALRNDKNEVSLQRIRAVAW